ncbi:TetR/AcrR family transcriptional regulator [Rhodospirillaceae bacterium SYSU D60014]|uniref:TetR/AcrR family transcriptional regulator n=1 Tax=Virgifigura deserti TaxID=2268457 RepID=UPI000E66CB5D
MARPKEFDEREALHKALEVFWRHGYEGSSLADLLAAMGLSKSSFYETFGSKQELFREALTRYQDAQLAQLRARLDDGCPARQSIESFFYAVVDKACPQSNGRGCMSCNEAVELAPHDPSVRRQIERHLSATEEIFADAIRRGQADGSIGGQHDAHRLARFLTVGLSGLQVMARAKSEPGRLEDSLAVMMAALN